MARRHLYFSREEDVQVLRDWHSDLDEYDHGGRARLRRAASPEEVLFEPAFMRLARALGQPFIRENQRLRLAAVAGLVAHVKEHDGSLSMPKQMGTAAENRGTSVVGEARFRRLLTTDDLTERYSQLLRIVALLGERQNLLDLADIASVWPPNMRQNWAFDYFAVAPESTKS